LDKLTERITGSWSFSVTGIPLERVITEYQKIEIYEDPTFFGRMMFIDGHFMTSERDEFFYHENLIHPSAITILNPTHALVIGGGDGGSAEELLKYPSMKSVTLCEIDLTVVELAEKYLSKIHRGCFDDPRLSLVIEDGYEFVKTANKAFDVIVLDLTDPGGPSTPLYSREFYARCKMRLALDGVMSMHLGSPFVNPDRVVRILNDLRSVFQNVVPYVVNVPLYGGMWMMVSCSDEHDPRELFPDQVDGRIEELGLTDLSYYNGFTHCSGFALPNLIKCK
jgi:spermidine synthase